MNRRQFLVRAGLVAPAVALPATTTPVAAQDFPVDHKFVIVWGGVLPNSTTVHPELIRRAKYAGPEPERAMCLESAPQLPQGWPEDRIDQLYPRPPQFQLHADVEVGTFDDLAKLLVERLRAACVRHWESIRHIGLDETKRQEIQAKLIPGSYPLATEGTPYWTALDLRRLEMNEARDRDAGSYPDVPNADLPPLLEAAAEKLGDPAGTLARRMRAVAAMIRQGQQLEDALMQVYGIDTRFACYVARVWRERLRHEAGELGPMTAEVQPDCSRPGAQWEGV